MQEYLDKVSKLYYQGEPIISDMEFDRLAAYYNYSNVGHRVTNGIPHYYPMWSLQKCFDLDDAPLLPEKCVNTPKLDGAAISLLYVNGELAMALTRGDGELGQDITDKVRLLVPIGINSHVTTQVTGEVVAPKTLPNARNYAAGALNLKDLDAFKERDLTFVAYDIIPKVHNLWTQDLADLQEQGFTTVLESCLEYVFPTDGVVFRYNDNMQFSLKGYTRHHPRGAFAYKKQKAGVVTTLLDVIWQVGKSGVVSPVAIVEPVMIGDAKVSRATLHNIEYIRALDLELGCKVEMIRSGEIIPRIVGRVG